MKKLKRYLHYSVLITILCFILVLILATLIPYERALSVIYYAPWFKWVFGVLFLALSVGWIITGFLLRKLKTLVLHVGIVMVLIGAILSGRSIQGTVSLKEGSTFESFNDDVRGRYTFPSHIKLLEFKEDGYVNTVLISEQEYKFSPSHPLEKWGYFFFTYEYDIKWDVKKVVLADEHGEEYTFVPSKNSQFISPYFLKFIGLRVNRENDTLAEFMVSKNENITGALFVSKKGILPPTHGLDLKLNESNFDVSYISTILIKKDPGLVLAFWGFGICFVGFIISLWDKRWMK